MNPLNQQILTSNFIIKEYTILLKEENLRVFLDEKKIQSIGIKSNCYIELTDRILNRKVNSFKFNKYAIIRIEGQNESAIQQCNRLLERHFPFYHQRREYIKQSENVLPNKSQVLGSNDSLPVRENEKRELFPQSLIQFDALHQWRLADSDNMPINKIVRHHDPLYYLWHLFLEKEPYDPKNITELNFKCDQMVSETNEKEEKKQLKFRKHNIYFNYPSKRKEYFRILKARNFLNKISMVNQTLSTSKQVSDMFEDIPTETYFNSEETRIWDNVTDLIILEIIDESVYIIKPSDLKPDWASSSDNGYSFEGVVDVINDEVDNPVDVTRPSDGNPELIYSQNETEDDVLQEILDFSIPPINSVNLHTNMAMSSVNKGPIKNKSTSVRINSLKIEEVENLLINLQRLTDKFNDYAKTIGALNKKPKNGKHLKKYCCLW